MYSFDDVQKLSNKIWIYKAEKMRPVNAIEYDLKEDNDWGASYFFADILSNSYFLNDVLINLERLTEIAREFEKTSGKPIDLTNTLQKNWIRVIFGYVTLPYLIHNAITQFDKIVDFEAEFRFFDGLTPEQIKAITDEQLLTKEAANYGGERILQIAETRNLFWRDKTTTIELPRLDFDRFLFQHRNEFEFLSFLNKKQVDNSLFIKQLDLVKIHTVHSEFFKKTPNLNDLMSGGKFVSETNGEYYRINLRAGDGLSKDALRDKYSAILWQNLLEKDCFNDDKDRLRFWYFRTVYHLGHVNIENFLPAECRTRFLVTALDIVVTEPDFENGDKEFYKLGTDSRFGRNLELLSSGGRPNELIGILDSEDLFDLYMNLGDILRGHSENLLYDQRSRHALTYFIGQLVKNDSHRAHNLINGLLEKANKRPFVFWYTCLMIEHSQPELLPFLAIDERIASLVFAIILKVRISNYTGKNEKYIKQSLVKELFEVIGGNLSQTTVISQARKAKVIFQCILRTTFKKFRIEPDKAENIKQSDEIRKILTEIELPGQHFDGDRKIKKYFISCLTDDFFKELTDFKPVDIYQNGMTSLPFIQLDLAVFLMSLADPEDYIISPNRPQGQLHQLTEYFKKTYLEVINIEDVPKRDFFGDGELKPTIPSWHNEPANVTLIGWDTACFHLEVNFQLEQFLSPAGLVFTGSTDKYDLHNRFVAQKLRTHLLVLIESFNRIFNNKRQFEHMGYPVNTVLKKLELRIKDYVIQYSISDPTSCRYDIFNESMERWFGRTHNAELLPIIGAIINRFSQENREAVIVELTKSEQFLRSLKILEKIVSEKERRRLLKILTDRDDFITIMDKLSFQDMQFVVSTLSQNEDFIAVAEDALAYAEIVSEKQNHPYLSNENKVFIFRMKLMQAYQKKSIQAINQVPNLGTNHYHGQQLSSEDEKDFYRGLVNLRTGNGKKAYELFHKLTSNANDDRPVLALNRFAAKLQWADEAKELAEKNAITYEALSQWEQFVSGYSNDKSWPAIRENIWYNRLHAYETLADYEKFDEVYAEVDAVTKMRPDFLAIRLEVLLKRKLQHPAEEILHEAKVFHQLADGNYPDFIEELEKLTNTPETLSFLAYQYDRIFRLPPEEIIQVIPAMVNGGKDLSTFILNEILQSAKDMLNLINILPEINYEDKYTDLLMVSLNGRLINYKWHTSNLRSGFSDNADDIKKQDNVGRIDFGILTSSNKRLAICEAMILEGKNTIETQKHDLKIFNYDPARNLYYIITYYKGSIETFDNSWESYVDVVEDFIEFPKGYPLNGQLVKLEQNEKHDALRVGKSIHGNNTELYHLFINVNYRLLTVKKKVGN